MSFYFSTNNTIISTESFTIVEVTFQKHHFFEKLKSTWTILAYEFVSLLLVLGNGLCLKFIFMLNIIFYFYCLVMQLSFLLEKKH